MYHLIYSNVFISGSCLILFLFRILLDPRRTDAKNDVKNYQECPTTVLSTSMGQPIPNIPKFWSAPPLFLEDEDIFQKSATLDGFYCNSTPYQRGRF
jgi:hypothetical protein